ncbi:MAG: hypothetical protein WBP12_02480 [Candidatus Saccharimonas sp.]
MNPQDTQPQPQPMPQTQAPPQPPMPQPTPQQITPAYPQQQPYQQPTAPIPPSIPPKSKKGLLIAIIGSVVSLIVIVLIVIALVAFNSVSKQDYHTLGDDLNDTSAAYSDMSSVYISSYSTDTEISNGIEKLKKSRDDFNTKLQQAGELKAVKKDKELKELYDAIIAKKPKFDKAVSASLEAYEKILPTVKSVNEISTSSSSNVATLIYDIKQKYEDISGLKDDNNKQYVNDTLALLTKLKTLAIKVQEGRDDFRKYDSQASTDFYDTLSDLSETERDWNSNLQKTTDDGELKDDLNKLWNATQKKILP